MTMIPMLTRKRMTTPMMKSPTSTRRRRTGPWATLAGGLLSFVAFTAQAQQPAPAAKPAASDSALCAAAKSYMDSHPEERQRLKALANPDSAGDFGALSWADWPDTLLIPATRALARGQFDSARAVAKKVTASRPEAAPWIDLQIKIMEVLPDTLRSLSATSLARRSDLNCEIGMGGNEISP